MKRAKRPSSRALVLALGSAALLFSGSAAAAGIPRPPGAIDHRGWELVSLADKGGVQVGYTSMPSPDGNRVLYDIVSGGVPGSTAGSRVKLMATRTASGWASKSILPPRLEMPGDNYLMGATTPDASRAVASVFDGVGGTPISPDMSFALLDGTGGQTVLYTSPTYFGPSGAELVASDDLAHVFANDPVAIDPSHVAGTSNVYDFGSGTPVLVSRMPSTGLAPACGVLTTSTPPGFAGSNTSTVQHWVSTDGSRAFFESRGDVCTDPGELYMRDLVAGTTTLISGPVVAGADLTVDRFLLATADGSQVFYRTATALDAADTNVHQDIYRWTAATGNQCLTCVVPDANVRTANGSTENAVVSEDGSHIYFTSASQYAGAPAPATNAAPNLYVWHGGTIDFIARVNSIASRPRNGGETTPDGNVLIFTSNRAELNTPDASNGGRFEYYRYDDRDRSITCVSCPSGGSPGTISVPISMSNVGSQTVPDHVRVVTDDGSMVFFRTSEALVPEDVNLGPDLYEWHDGTVKLITSGVMQYISSRLGPDFVTATANGRDFFFQDYAALTPDVQDSANKLFDARVDGGFMPPATPAPPCVGDQCQGTSPAAPALSDVGSLSLEGAGNLVPAPRVSFALGRITAAQRARLARTGRLTLSVRVSTAGRVSALAQARIGTRTRTVARASRTAARGGVVQLGLTLSRAARAQLARSGRLRLVLGVRFSKVPVSRRVVLSLRTASHGR